MDVWAITVAVLRRWYVFLPLLALTAFGALKVGEGVAPTYEVSATAILMPGAESSDGDRPYGNLDNTATVLEIVLDDVATRDRIAGQGLQRDYDFSSRSRSRIVTVTVLSPSPEISLDTAQAVIDVGSQELAARQDALGVPEAAQDHLQVLQAPSVSEVVTEGKMRNMAVVGIVGGALSLLVAVLFDDLVGLFRRWRQRRAGRGRAQRDSAGPDEVHSETRKSERPSEQESAPTRRSTRTRGVEAANVEKPSDDSDVRLRSTPSARQDEPGPVMPARRVMTQG